MRPHVIFLIALIVATIASGFVLYQERTVDWAAIPRGASINVKDDLLNLFDRLHDENKRLRRGESVDLLDVMLPDRSHVILSINEAAIDKTGLLGLQPIPGAMLVNSVDEYRN